jgi:hypothetical protein
MHIHKITSKVLGLVLVALFLLTAPLSAAEILGAASDSQQDASVTTTSTTFSDVLA